MVLNSLSFCLSGKLLFLLHIWMRSTPVFLLVESHGQRSLVGYSPWGCKESDTPDRLHLHFHHVGYSNLGCKLFSFIALSMSCHSFLAWRVSIERAAVILMGIPCMLFVVFPLMLLIFVLCVWSLLIWLICALGCFTLSLFCLGFSGFLGRGWLFPSPF